MFDQRRGLVTAPCTSFDLLTHGQAVHHLGVSLNAAQPKLLRCRQWRWQFVSSRRGSTYSCLGDQAQLIGGWGWTSSAGPSCSGLSLALSWRVARLTQTRAVRRIRTRQYPVREHVRPARCLPLRPRQRRRSRIHFPAGELAPTPPRRRPSSAGIRARDQLPGGSMFHASLYGCQQPTESLPSPWTHVAAEPAVAMTSN
jgi:hypothetical protein